MNELEKEAGMEEASNFHWSFTKLQWESFLLLLDASAFLSWSLTLTSSQPVGHERRDGCQNQTNPANTDL